MPPSVLVLCPVLPGPWRPAAELPLGRAAQALITEGIRVVFSNGLARDGLATGRVVTRDGDWREVSDVAVSAVYDRFPSQALATEHAAARAAFPEAVWANDPTIVERCRDKLLCQRLLESSGVAMPEVIEAADDAATQTLRGWGAAFAKPRFGAFGVGVHRVEANAEVPLMSPSVLEGQREPTLLQRAIAPPAMTLPGLGVIAAMSIRALVQREGREWVVNHPVARCSASDPVANAHRGAATFGLREALSHVRSAPTDTFERIEALALEAVRGLEVLAPVDRFVEAGVDVVLDEEWRPWVIEVNSRPRGHLAALARRVPEQWGAAHHEACARPLRTLAGAFA